jgi:YD repeat-containing protein
MFAFEIGASTQYNGNIAGITYQNQNDISREYRYRYDKLSRLLSARNPNGL